MAHTGDISVLRDPLYNPSPESWKVICALFDSWPDDTLLTALEYAQEHLDSDWPDELRAPPKEWIESIAHRKVPRGWPLVEAYNVWLHDHGRKKIQVIKTLREHARVPLGLKDAKLMSERAPVCVEEALALDKARAYADALKRAGAKADIERHEPEPDWDVVSPRVFDPDLLSSVPTLEFPPTASNIHVKMKSFGNKKIMVIKALRTLTGLGLKDAKNLVESVPCFVAEGCDLYRATEIKEQLEAVGALIALETEGGETPEPMVASNGYKVVLESWGSRKIAVIKAVRRLTGLGLKDSKNLVESAPCTLLEGRSREEAQTIKTELQEAGAKAKIALC